MWPPDEVKSVAEQSPFSCRCMPCQPGARPITSTMISTPPGASVAWTCPAKPLALLLRSDIAAFITEGGWAIAEPPATAIAAAHTSIHDFISITPVDETLARRPFFCARAVGMLTLGRRNRPRFRREKRLKFT